MLVFGNFERGDPRTFVGDWSNLSCLTFQKFNDVIDSSRAEAERAEANIPEIERLISSANNKSNEATDKLGDAKDRAEKAQSIAEQARETANKTQQVRKTQALPPSSLCAPF